MRLVALVLLFVYVLDAQCVMCREAAASQKDAAISALNSGIVALAVPLAGALVFVGRLLRRYSG